MTLQEEKKNSKLKLVANCILHYYNYQNFKTAIGLSSVYIQYSARITEEEKVE